MLRSSRAVFSSAILNRLRCACASVPARSATVVISCSAGCALRRRSTPHTSATDVSASSLTRRAGSLGLTTPPVCSCQRFVRVDTNYRPPDQARGLHVPSGHGEEEDLRHDPVRCFSHNINAGNHQSAPTNFVKKIQKTSKNTRDEDKKNIGKSMFFNG